MRVFYSKKFLHHSLGPGHPECPERLKVILEGIRELKPKIIEPKNIDEDALYIVHSKEYIEKLKALSSKGAQFPDNTFSRDTFKIAKLAAAAAKEAALNCENEFSFALVRPPGHHAGKDFFGGFCYINNVAFAAKCLQKKKDVKVLICDFDYHAGNGSWDIFYDDPSIYYLSFHCDPRVAYPGTCFEHENTDHMQNVCLSPATTDAEYLEKFERNVRNAFEKFKPDVIGLSAGFDTFHLDPIAGLQIKNTETYTKIGEIISSLDRPTFATLEGGYYTPKLGEMVRNFSSAF